MGYERVLKLVHTHGVPWDIREHSAVSSIDDVLEVLDLQVEQMVKSVVLELQAPRQSNLEGPDEDHIGRLCLVALPGDRKVEISKLARHLAIRRSDIRFASPEQVERLT